MDSVKKRIMLKGDAVGIMTIWGGRTLSYEIEWLKGSAGGTVFFFVSPDIYCASENGRAELPAKNISAVAVGEDLGVRGQLLPFSWEKAKEKLNIDAYMKREAEHGDKTGMPPSGSDEKTERKEAAETGSAKETVSFVCPVNRQGREVTMFRSAFPDSVWFEHEYISTGKPRRYFSGMIYREDRAVSTAVAVPGTFSSKPPPWLKDFSMCLMGEDRMTYWLSVEDIT